MIIAVIVILLLLLYLINHYLRINPIEKLSELLEIIWFYGLRIFFIFIAIYGIYDFFYLKNYLYGLVEFCAGIFCLYLSIKDSFWT